jgi:hypothetical protein
VRQTHDRATVELLVDLLKEAREELVRADGKASILLAAAGVIVGTTAAAILAGDWSPFDLLPVPAHLWWAGVGAAVAGIGALGFTVYPRTKRNKAAPHLVAYFADVTAFEDSNALAQALRRTASGQGSRDVDQLVLISRIVVSKYRGIRWALNAFAAGAALIVAATIFQAVLV